MPQTGLHTVTAPRFIRYLEMVMLYLLLPGGYLALREFGGFQIPFIAPLLIAVIYCWIILRRDPGFNRKEYGWNGFRAWKKMLGNWLVYVVLSIIVVWLWQPGQLFNLPRENPWLTLAIWIFYPLWSVIPQELYYRVFFMHRYRDLLPLPWLIALNGLLFGLVHLLFGHWLSVVLTFFLGCWLAWQYYRRRSMLAVSAEHGLYGNWAFTVGLGVYFYRPVI